MNLFAPNVADGYKVGHRPMFPKGANFTYGNLTARADRLFERSVSKSQFWDHKVVWAGLQGILQELNELWERSFFSKPKDEVIKRYKRRMDYYLGEGKVPVDGFERLHDLGYLPIEVLSLPEGSRVNMNVPLYTIYNTHPDFFWFTNYLETSMSALIWKIVTCSTIAFEYRRVLKHWAQVTGTPKEFVDVQGHDFSFRGIGLEDVRGSFGHLLSFCGTDTIPAIDYAEDYYGANVEKEFVACSIPATEHAVATANILSELHYELEKLGDSKVDAEGYARMRLEAEKRFFKRLITEVYPNGAVALVSDSFDFWGVVTKIVPELKDVILSRPKDSLGLAKVVIRPDSGDPVEIICGAEIHTQAEAELMLYRRGREDGRKKHIYFRDSEGKLFKATDAINRNRNRSWAELDADILERAGRTVVDSFQGMTETSRKLSPERLPMETHDPVKPMIYGFLKSMEIELEYDLAGRYQCGYHILPHELTAEEKGAVECLWETFGGTTTAEGYKLLDEHIGLIYGDSITVQRTEEIMRRLAKKGFASGNVVLGIGSYTYQYITRDTFGQAIKGTAIQIEDTLIDLYKAPATEGETAKKSAKGFLRVDKVGDDFVLAQEQEMSFDTLATSSGELRSVFKNSQFTNRTTLGEIRERLGGATY